MRRRVGLIPGVIAIVLAAGCQPAPPPASWVPPQLTSVTVVPEVVPAGSPVTVTLTATDDRAVHGFSLGFIQPSGAGYDPITCSLDGVPQPGNNFLVNPRQAVISVQVSCPIPAGAPDGAWQVTVSATDGEGVVPGRTPTATRSFQVVGGSGDQQPPTIESVTVSPDPLVTGSKFDLIVRVADDAALSGSTAVPFMNYVGTHVSAYGRPCYSPTATQVASNVVEWRFPCQPNTDGKFGTYIAYFRVYDTAGNHLDGEHAFEMVAAG